MKHFVKVKTLLNKFIRDKDGHVAVWQAPNLLLVGWAACRLIAFFVKGDGKAVFGYLGTALLLVWAYLEISQGASYFRRVVGGVVLLGIIAPYVM